MSYQPSLQDVQRVAGGQACALVVHTDGRISACGNAHRLAAPSAAEGAAAGTGGVPSATGPRPVAGPLGRSSGGGVGGVATISVSKRGHDGHVLAVTADGELYAWGDGEQAVSPNTYMVVLS